MKRIYDFEEGDGKNKRLLGGKGAGLCEMTKIGLPVPPGFTITTEVCLEYYKEGRKLPDGLMDEVKQHINTIEKKTGKKFGDPKNPLLVSVRSGAALSMPGMMDTILNLGLNDETVIGLAKQTGDERFAYDCYRRLIQMFSRIAMQADGEKFDKKLEEVKAKYGAKYDTDLSVKALKELIGEFKKICEEDTGREFPTSPYEQLKMAIEAVFSSWMGRRAVEYRRINKITPEMANGTAVTVQTMVFGNRGVDSATGVAFTRDPGTGENVFYGEYLVNAQGEDVVAGIRTPKPIIEMEKELPECYKELCKVREILEKHYKEVQDFEFTIEKGKLYVLQTRNGKMNAMATIKTSVDMYKEGILSKDEALLRVRPEQLEQLLHRTIDPNYSGKPVASGLAASPGAASGKVVFDADTAAELGSKGEKVILVREETKPDDIHGFFAAQGVLTSRGGKTSHAAVVARGMGKPCVSGCEQIKIDDRHKFFTVAGIQVKEGDIITIDGSTGAVYLGNVPTKEPELPKELEEILKWADEKRRLGVRANADTPEDARKARELGAEGIGLCRTERMFNAVDRLPIVQKMILAESEQERKEYLSKLLPIQKNDFIEIFKSMNGLPVTVRLLDPPLHEFLPSLEGLLLEITEMKSKNLDTTEKEEILRKVKGLIEVNPMMGHRGVRLGITYPEIYEMQTRAILEAAVELIKDGYDVKPEIMIPQVALASELEYLKQRLENIVQEVMEKSGVKVKYSFGTMMEVVRSCLVAGEIAKYAEFFSFGTNDLTQGTFSFSREDAENKFLPRYLDKGILKFNPFETLDKDGVGRLMQIAIQEGRKVRPDLKVGICGEHGGEPESVRFCSKIGLDYVSCSVYRVPVARLAAAQEVVQITDL
ncbi:MAG: pyruvate, phosphate dikinase [Candidatus Bathyarchaeia archaeon]|nr:pyruvate, phosphate dikinase [Candidatus Bathyarchaeota archaeon]